MLMRGNLRKYSSVAREWAAVSGTQNELFERSEEGGSGFATVAVFALCAILVFGGFFMMGSSFSMGDNGLWMFAGALAATALGFWIAFGLWPNRKR